MKRFAKSMHGVTLLEIMLVLAIAAMIIVMSVRYYQSASTSQQANAFIAQLNAMQAAADSLSQGVGTYASIGSGSIAALVGGGAAAMVTPWNGAITVSGGSTTMQYTVAGTYPAGICALVTARFKSTTKWSVASGCSTIEYDSSK